MSAERIRSILVVTPCSARKAYWSLDLPTKEDLALPDRRAAAFERLAIQRLPARDMYTGQHHRSVLQNVDRLRRELPSIHCELAIVSAGYGVLEETTPIVPYEATFRGLPRQKAIYQAHQLGIRKKLEERLSVVDVGMFVLGKTYLEAIEAPIIRAPLEVYFRSQSPFQASDLAVTIPAGRAEARVLGVAPRMVAATIFQRFVDVVVQVGWADALDNLLHGDLNVSDVRLKAHRCSLTG